MGFLCCSVGKGSACSAGDKRDASSIPGLFSLPPILLSHRINDFFTQFDRTWASSLQKKSFLIIYCCLGASPPVDSELVCHGSYRCMFSSLSVCPLALSSLKAGTCFLFNPLVSSILSPTQQRLKIPLMNR